MYYNCLNGAVHKTKFMVMHQSVIKRVVKFNWHCDLSFCYDYTPKCDALVNSGAVHKPVAVIMHSSS